MTRMFARFTEPLAGIGVVVALRIGSYGRLLHRSIPCKITG